MERYKAAVGGTTYTLQLMGADQAVEVLFRVGEALGGPLETLLQAAGPEWDLAEVFRDQNTMALGVKVVSLLIKNLGSHAFLVIRDMLLHNLGIDGRVAAPVNDVSAHFAGKSMDMVLLMWAALQHNYDDFLSALRSTFGQSIAESSPAKEAPPALA
ncbi:MAG: hypothetical protein HC814_02135 [Rhodobacteraceae bacterium]|nr:hypothetical protein [Paracoccaceae bacterium]